jgi:hypothetical protein
LPVQETEPRSGDISETCMIVPMSGSKNKSYRDVTGQHKIVGQCPEVDGSRVLSPQHRTMKRKEHLWHRTGAIKYLPTTHKALPTTFNISFSRDE